MPITQERLRRTLEAGEQFGKQYYILRAQIERSLSAYHSGRASADDTLAALSAHIMAAPPYMPADAVLREERTRYQYTRSRNEIEKRRMARRRSEAGIEPRRTVPEPPIPSLDIESIEHGNEIADEIDAAIDADISTWKPVVRDLAGEATDADKAEYERIMGKKWEDQ